MSTEAVPFRDTHDCRRHLADAASWLVLARSSEATRAVRLRAAGEAATRAMVVIGSASTRFAAEASALWDEAEEWVAALAAPSGAVVVRRGWLAPVADGLRAAVAANEAA